jgi:EmrB/QacA subfamily drug resistance transporter
MAGVLATMLMSALDQTVVSTAMPKIISELHGFENYSGPITAYMVASTASIPIVGKLSDFYGRRLFLLLGVVLFVFASLLCGLSASMEQLIAFRGLQGIGAGVCQAMAFTTIADLFPPARRGRISGFMGAVFGLASVIGPALGGFLTDGPGWRYVFYVNLPFGLLAFAVLYYFFPKIISGKNKPRIDYWGSLTLVTSVVPILLALSWGGRHYAWDSPQLMFLFAFGIFSSALFVFAERRAPEPILPFHLFRHQIIWSSLLVSSLISVGMFGATLFIPLFIQTAIGSTATRSGAVMMPMSLALILTAMLSGQLITRFERYRFLAIGGAGLTALGTFLLSRMDIHTPASTVVRNMIIMGTGLGLTLPVFTIAVQNAVEVHFVGIATSTVQFVRSVGGALGAAVFGSVLANRFLPSFLAQLPPDLAAHAPMDQLSQLNNPQTLVQPGSAEMIQSAFKAAGVSGPEVLASVQMSARLGLALSLHEVFILGTILLLIATGFAFFVKDIPLRKTNRPGAGLTDAN